LKVWLSLRYHGLDAFRTALARDLDHAQHLARAVQECAELELVATGELSAVCFRHLLRPDASEEERNDFNLALMKRMVKRGRVYLSNATLRGKFCLRACIVNHLTKDLDIDGVVPEVGHGAGHRGCVIFVNCLYNLLLEAAAESFVRCNRRACDCVADQCRAHLSASTFQLRQ
jgi:glutamate/tyrosine decarboxylase-like PLP-dependent enzyme